MEFGKRRDTTDTTDVCPRQLVTDLIRGNWCNIYNFIHHKVAINSKNIQQWKLGTEKQTKY